jgi:hypothetical protein
VDEARRASERAATRGDGAAWWVAQLRAGAVGRADLELAVWCADPGARAALGPSVLAREPRAIRASYPGRSSRRGSRLGEWLQGLDRWGSPAPIRGVLAILTAVGGAAGSGAHTAALAAALEAWCEAPTHEARARLTRLVADHDPRARTDAGLFVTLARQAAACAGDPSGADLRHWRHHWASQLLPEPLHAQGLATAREALLALARRGASLAWERHWLAPLRSAPSPTLAPGPPDGTPDDALAGLAPERLELAAWLGDPGAQRRLGGSVLCRWPGQNGWEGSPGDADRVQGSDLAVWLRELRAWGDTPRLLAHRALGDVGLRLLRDPGEASRAAHLLRLTRAGPVDPATLRRLVDDSSLGRRPRTRPEGAALLVEEAARLAAGKTWSPADWDHAALRAGATLVGHQPAAVEAVRAALLPWLSSSGTEGGAGKGLPGRPEASDARRDAEDGPRGDPGAPTAPPER